MDVLTHALNELRIQSVLYCQAELTAPWGFTSNYNKGAAFYIVIEGRCWLEAENSEPCWLTAGDFVTLPHCPPHVLRDAPESPVVALETLMEQAEAGLKPTLRFGGGGATTHILGGCFWFDAPELSSLLPALPSLLCVTSEQGKTPDWLQMALAFVAAEADNMRPGAQSIIANLSNILFIQAIRASLNQFPASGNWLGALRDPEIGCAVSLIHQRLDYPWTVVALAGEVAMSRSAFAARFAVCMGEPPVRYITRVRMQRAARVLRTTQKTIAEIAAQLGYQTEMAFSKAFKKQFGIAPGRYRK